MTEPTFDEMRRAVYKRFGAACEKHEDTAALNLLHVMGKSYGVNFNVRVSGSSYRGDWDYVVWTGDLLPQDTPPEDCYHAATLGEAAIKCAYDQILNPEGGTS